MKILSATPKPHAPTTYIVQLSARELSALCLVTAYNEVYVKQSNGNILSRKVDELSAEDTIDPEFIASNRDLLLGIIETSGELKKSIANQRSALTRLSTSIARAMQIGLPSEKASPKLQKAWGDWQEHLRALRNGVMGRDAAEAAAEAILCDVGTHGEPAVIAAIASAIANKSKQLSFEEPA